MLHNRFLPGFCVDGNVRNVAPMGTSSLEDVPKRLPAALDEVLSRVSLTCQPVNDMVQL